MAVPGKAVVASYLSVKASPPSTPNLPSFTPVMPSSEYTSAGGGLKLKGAKNAGIDKKRKKKSSSKSTAVAAASSASKEATPAKDTATDPENTTDLEQREKNKEESLIPDDGKTEYERRHEETRRKRLEERLMREGVKTHKERVEELNKYLSTLSEHHDMPRIGPG
ncbi:DUF1754-domain-containing protein [Aureobasidium pullulans]|nr:DUF1754-domain-containing protein [Aureobasidium pullulans]